MVILSFSLLGFNVLFVTNAGNDVMITDFYSCDAIGVPQDYFPKKTTAYFNVTVTNNAQYAKSISLDLSVKDELDVPIGVDQLSSSVPPNASAYYIMKIFIPKWAYVGVATAFASLWVEGVPIEGKYTSFYIGPVDLTPPTIHILSPENVTYTTDVVSLILAVNERTTWMGYSLNGLGNVTISGNTTLTSLLNGAYAMTVYANDTSSNTGSSQAYFTVAVVHDISANSLSCLPTEIYMGQAVNITVSVQNEGTVTEIFNVTTYANASAIQTQTITLESRASTSIVFTWNTTDAPPGNYTISAYAHPVIHETDIEDNTCTNGIVRIIKRDIAIITTTASKTIIGQGFCLDINCTVVNRGDHVETFDVFAYADSFLIKELQITLNPKENKTLSFTWNTTDFAYSNYNISIYATLLPGETNTEDNTFIYGMVKVTIPGDINGDFNVQLLDLVLFATAYNSYLGEPKWNPNADIDNNLVANLADLVIVAKHYGQHYP